MGSNKKEINEVRYEVKLERKLKKSKVDRLLEGEYWWDIDVYVNNHWHYSLDGSGWAHSLKKAKAKAIKHIMEVEDKVSSMPGKFGIIFKADRLEAGAAIEAIESIPDED